MRINITTARIRKFGTGVFMTKMDPTESVSQLLHNIYLNNQKYESRLECAFAINMYDIDAIEFKDPMYPSRDLWRTNSSIHLNGKHFFLVIRQ
jgi:hypothetical protein